MYDENYKNMVAARIAVQLPQPVFMDADGNIVANEEEILNFDICKNQPNCPLGLRCDTKITHPDYLLFFDETGSNKNQKKDGYFGVRSLVVGGV
jgi:hypothetical protein